MKICAHIITASLLGMTAASQAAVIAGGNGSFETVTLDAPATHPNAWYLTNVTISGWTLATRTANPNGATWFMGEPTYGLAPPHAPIFEPPNDVPVAANPKNQSPVNRGANRALFGRLNVTVP